MITIRNTLFASFLALGAGATGAQAFDHGAPLSDTGGGAIEAAHAPPSGNVVGGGHVTVAGGGDDMSYQALSGARMQEPGAIGWLVGGGAGTRVVHEHAAPSTVRLADARRR